MSTLANHTCGCLSGLTDKQAVWLELAGMLEMLEWKLGQVRSTYVPSNPADAALHDRLLKWQASVTRLLLTARAEGWVKP